MRLKGQLGLAYRLREPILFTQGFRLPTLLEMDSKPHLTQQVVQVLFAYLHWAKSSIPPSSFALAGDSLDILNHDICQGQDFPQVSHNSRLGFPSTTG